MRESTINQEKTKYFYLVCRLIHNYTVANFFCRSEMLDDPMEFNDKKRKLLGEKIHNSFLHPKPFKIGQLQMKPEASPKKLSDESKKRKLDPEMTTNTSDKKKHKFQLI
jgi:hypothetical protein